MNTSYAISTVVSQSYLVESMQAQQQRGAEVASLQLTDNLINKNMKKAISVKRAGNINQSNIELKKKKDSNDAYTQQNKNDTNRSIDITI